MTSVAEDVDGTGSGVGDIDEIDVGGGGVDGIKGEGGNESEAVIVVVCRPDSRCNGGKGSAI